MKKIAILFLLLLTGCSIGSEKWTTLTVDQFNDCKPGSTATLRFITNSYNRGVEMTCQWIVKEDK